MQGRERRLAPLDLLLQCRPRQARELVLGRVVVAQSLLKQPARSRTLYDRRLTAGYHDRKTGDTATCATVAQTRCGGGYVCWMLRASRLQGLVHDGASRLDVHVVARVLAVPQHRVAQPSQPEPRRQPVCLMHRQQCSETSRVLRYPRWRQHLATAGCGMSSRSAAGPARRRIAG